MIIKKEFLPLSPILPDCLYRFSLALTTVISSARLDPETSDSSLEPRDDPSPSSLARAASVTPEGIGGEREEGPPHSVHTPPPPPDRSSSR